MSTKDRVQSIFDESRNGTNDYYKHSLVRNFVYTDGIREVAQAAGAYWLLDILATEFAQALLRNFNQGGSHLAYCNLLVTGTSAKLTAEMQDPRGVDFTVSKTIDYTDFPEGDWPFKLAVNAAHGNRMVVVCCLYSED